MKEEWRPVVGYEGFYEVSNLGNVRSIAVYSYKYKRVIQRRVPTIKVQETTHDGYKRVTLCYYGKKKHWMVHRLVALAFIPNQDNLPEVNHRNENTANNYVSNLEWCSRTYNANYGTLPKRIKERMNTSHPTAKAVYQYKMDGTFITAYPSLNEAGRAVGLTGNAIQKVCKGKNKSAAGFKWCYAV